MENSVSFSRVNHKSSFIGIHCESENYGFGITYRGVVISGLVHNDDPSAAKLWMPAGSFWTQPAGEEHITSAQGKTNVAFIEIDSGPYLVRPSREAFDNGERPVNIEKTNLVWLDASEISWLRESTAMISYLWGKRGAGEFNGTMIRLPADFRGSIQSEGDIFRGVLIKGATDYTSAQINGVKKLTPGSYFGSKGKTTHTLFGNKTQESLIYVRTNGPIKILSEE